MSQEDEPFAIKLEGDTLKLSGELTIYSAAALKEPMMTTLANLPVAAINLAGVHEIDSAGLQLLLVAKQEAERQQRPLHLEAPSGAVTELIELYRLADFFV